MPGAQGRNRGLAASRAGADPMLSPDTHLL